ncbi:MFS transporter [Microlunatus flavus]|uniref:Major Facilitator Superfamily protein n=1 Tax=Microlunatus flavus TaxID=1036181 RepID=A0A1H9GBA7_9ACTN|nr:MFS transporter [Microlunatus flavus]SEQ47364.1 Major Facilitator Superfamily protein [Microlunatus flavus]
MQDVGRGSRWVIGASTVAMLGWGTVLPYQYAYAAETRGWGGAVAAIGASLFSVAALVAGPVGGRLADRFAPALVAVVAKLAAALAVGSLVLADTPTAYVLGMTAFGFAMAAAGPAQSVLLLGASEGADRRTMFAWLAAGQALGMGVGAFVAGYLVDLAAPDGLDVGFVAAAVGYLVSAGMMAVLPRERTQAAGSAGLARGRGEAGAAMRLVLRAPALRWTAVLTVALALAFYAQFDTGLPAYALTVLDVPARTVGLAAAVNCFVLIALQLAVVRWTAHRPAAPLLMAVGAIWLACWVALGVVASFPALAAVVLVGTFGVFALGETMYGPVLNPLVASLAPQGHLGATLGLFTGLQTGVSALGPLVAGLALSGGHGEGFVGLHVLISAVAIGAAWQVHRHLAAQRVPAAVEEQADESLQRA